MKIHPYLFYSKQALCLQLPTTNPGTARVYERERNCTISPTFTLYLENTIIKDLALKDKNLLPPTAPQPGEERRCIPNEQLSLGGLGRTPRHALFIKPK